MPYPTSTLPTYAATTPAIMRRAIDRSLLHPDGTANLATPQAQHRKTVEEIGEASLELRKLAKTRALSEKLVAMGTPDLVYDAVAILHRRKHRLALEFGDVLVTLALQAALQGVGLEGCRSIPQNPGPVRTWRHIDIWAGGLALALNAINVTGRPSPRTPEYIGAVIRCTEDAARIELALTGPECMALAFAEITKEYLVNA